MPAVRSPGELLHRSQAGDQGVRYSPPWSRLGALIAAGPGGISSRHDPHRRSRRRRPAGGLRRGRRDGATGRAAGLCPGRTGQGRVLAVRGVLPEWQALRYAVRNSVPVRFCDLPATVVLAAEDEPGDRFDPLTALAEAGGYDDAERWWDAVVESAPDADAFDPITEAMGALRDSAEQTAREQQPVPGTTEHAPANTETRNEPAHSKPPQTASAHGRPGHGEPTHSESTRSAHDQPAHGAPAPGQPGHGEPTRGEATRGVRAHDQTAQGAPAHRPATGERAHNESARGEPARGGRTDNESAHDRAAGEPAHDSHAHHEPIPGESTDTEALEANSVAEALSDADISRPAPPDPITIDANTLRREAYMRQTMRKALKDGAVRLAVVCGAWHAPALTGKLGPAAPDTRLLKGLPKTKTRLTWVPWTHSRLSTTSGYGAGVTSPGWYHHLFTETEQPIVRWLTKVAGVLRAHDLPVSSAHIIESVRLADTRRAARPPTRGAVGGHRGDQVGDVRGRRDDAASGGRRARRRRGARQRSRGDTDRPAGRGPTRQDPVTT